MSDESIDERVRNWYSITQEFRPYPKDGTFADTVMVGDGKLFTDAEVLNLGCFYPDDEIKYAKLAKRWVAVDFTPSVIERCKQIPAARPASFFVADVRRLVAFATSTFDVVCDFSTGDHLLAEDFVKMLSEAHRVLRRGGHFIIAYYNRRWKANHLDGDPRADFGYQFGYWRTNTPEEMRGLLEAAGFTVLRSVLEDDARAGMLARKE